MLERHFYVRIVLALIPRDLRILHQRQVEFNRLFDKGIFLYAIPVCFEFHDRYWCLFSKSLTHS